MFDFCICLSACFVDGQNRAIKQAYKIKGRRTDLTLLATSFEKRVRLLLNKKEGLK